LTGLASEHIIKGRYLKNFKEETLESFFQANGLWLVIVAFILGLILLIKAIREEDKCQKEENWFMGSASLMTIVMAVLIVAFIVSLGEQKWEQKWEILRILYLISLGGFFLSYAFYKTGKSKASAIIGSPDQEVKNSQKKLKEKIKKQKKEINIK